jgi:hypothetical protein
MACQMYEIMRWKKISCHTLKFCVVINTRRDNKIPSRVIAECKTVTWRMCRICI